MMNAAWEKRLRKINPALERYASAVRLEHLEESVIRLFCHAHYARRLVLKEDFAGEILASLHGETRRGDLAENLIQADGLADTTLQAYDWYDPHDVPHFPADEVQSICKFNKEIRVTYFAPKWGRVWRDNDDCFIYQSRRPFSPLKVPVIAVEAAMKRHVEDFDESRWADVHPLIHATMRLVTFMQILPFAEANGRTARMMFAITLRRAGWPALPWEAVFERCYGQYQGFLRHAIENKELDAFISFMLESCGRAIELGSRMVDTMIDRRRELTAALVDQGIKADPAQRISADLLGGALVMNVRRHGVQTPLHVPLAKLCSQGLLQIVRTPTGVAYSVPDIRKLII